jgi:hypothetical protein
MTSPSGESFPFGIIPSVRCAQARFRRVTSAHLQILLQNSL